MDINDLLILCSHNNASDLHLSSGLSPMMRIDGELQYIDAPILDNHTILTFIYEIMSEQHRYDYETLHEIDFAYETPQQVRFRVNVFNHQRGIGSVFRRIPTRILTVDELGLPDIYREIMQCRHGLILVTGPAGSGKSTTLAAMIDYINKTQFSHILTIEDPIEFVHRSKQCLVTQREVGRDSKSFKNALRAALREDPNVILLGEMRDLETIQAALTAAETGHLVLATLHTTSAVKTIDRIIDVFPTEEKNMVRFQLAESLQAVISQILVKKRTGGRIAAQEILLCNHAIRHLIRENKTTQIYSTMQAGLKNGMRTLDQHLKQLTEQCIVTKPVAEACALYKERFAELRE